MSYIDEYICEAKGCYEKVVQFMDGHQWCAKHTPKVTTGPSYGNIKRITEECKEALRMQRFVRYCQMEGLGSVEAEEDRYYSIGQEEFFAEYEAQMEWESRLISRRRGVSSKPPSA